ncbi:MAG TPA: hypothetical protein VFF49_10805 [Thermodesulfobacteriota bacterium]|nr:hypothetical protein [Thermodesulfobacteriota bacterium]
MIIVSVDLGIHTGIYCSDWNEQKMSFGTSLQVTLEIKAVEKFLVKLSPELIILERMPPALSGVLARTYQNILRDYQVQLISPSEWKPYAERYGDNLRGSTKHERDALAIFQYWFWLKENKKWTYQER